MKMRFLNILFFILFVTSISANPAEEFQEFTTDRCLIRKVKSFEQQQIYAAILKQVIGNSDVDNQEEALERNEHGYYNPEHISAFGDYLIFIRGDEHPIGVISFVNPGHTTQFPAHTEVATDILEQHQGKGYGSEVFKAFCLKFEKLIDTQPAMIEPEEEGHYQLANMQVPFKGIISFVDALSNYGSYKKNITAGALPIGIRGRTICCLYPATNPLPKESIQALSSLTKKLMATMNETTPDPNMWLLKRKKETENCAEEWRTLAAQTTDILTRFVAIKHLVEADLMRFEDHITPDLVRELATFDRTKDCYGTLFSLLGFLKYRNAEIDALLDNLSL